MTGFDWGAHWQASDRRELSTMRAAGERMADRLERYHETMPASVASVGCGPAFCSFALAERYPSVTVVGYDASERVVRENRACAVARGTRNLRFRRARLPTFDPGRQFELVVCVATLHYVREPERALRALDDAVAPGGRLVFNYPNHHTRRVYETDPETDEDRFRLLLAGENLLSYRQIRETLGREPRSFWKAVGEDDWRESGRTNPCVVVEKPA